jgi:hypothetical protein
MIVSKANVEVDMVVLGFVWLSSALSKIWKFRRILRMYFIETTFPAIGTYATCIYV